MRPRGQRGGLAREAVAHTWLSLVSGSGVRSRSGAPLKSTRWRGLCRAAPPTSATAARFVITKELGCVVSYKRCERSSAVFMPCRKL